MGKEKQSDTTGRTDDAFSKEKIEELRARHDKSYKKILAVETKFPFIKRISRHPRWGHWVPVMVATVEVAASFLVLGLFGYLISLIPWPSFNIPFPEIDLPSIPLPDISLPSIPLPSISLPDLPPWLETVFYWMKRTWPIWIAVIFAIAASKKKK